ncbi:hypothetical protein ABIC37_005429 [Priestia megaterium]|uniref:phage minor head protein n=1 Tax=Priestia megaterium TaxID=1404 RepID=UPI0033946807
MAFLDWLSFRKKRIDNDIRQIVNTSVRASIGSVRGRQTKDRWQQQFLWYDEGVIQRDELRSAEIMEKLKIIRDINPDASMSAWNLLRLGNNSHEVEVQKPSGAVDKRATELLNEHAKWLGKMYGGGIDQLINVLLLTSYTQGAIALEVEIAENVKEVVDFHAVDPMGLDYKRNKDTGELELVQKQADGTYKVLNPETVFYYPFDPDIGNPFGRSPMTPILQIVFFQVQVLSDLQKVVHHQGHPRFDISVMEEAIIENIPEHIKNQGPEVVRDFVQGYIADVQEQMSNLEPDSDFFHTDSIKVEMAGATTGGQMLDVQRLMSVINQQIVTSLKQLPILLGRNEGVSETHGSIQWQIYVKGIESIQRGVKRLLERAYNVVLQLNGIQGSAHITFETLQTSDRKTDAEAESIETATKIMQVQQGWIDHDEAANEMVGHPAVGDPIPINQPSNSGEVQPQEEDSGSDSSKQPSETDDGNDNTSRSVKKNGNFTRSDDIDDFFSSINEEWATDLARITKRAKRSYLRFLEKQRDLYIDRLKKASDIPTRALIDIRSLKSVKRDTIPDPSEAFRYWVQSQITNDSFEQISFWNDLISGFMEEAIVLTGSYTLASLDLDMEFDFRDTKMLRWLQERSYREAQLIQGVTDEFVLQTLWDSVYDGNYSEKKAAEDLTRGFAFKPSRSATIARTEILGAGRSGQYHADVQSGIVIGKKWGSALQERTREGHREANGQIVDLEAPFYVANGKGQLEPLLFPGDSSLGCSADNVINCRCFYTRILEGEEMK